ncbi:MAG: hypothetical protein A3E01_20040 [Gammaproteobacteria bacterium RIFCSPHIGHO2_12_FULL_63_22]|nr:MAG: hypothetical protein A3E01_20040 [Gammaproteobacteria bacterium RIFCSPHIGHO2_12_FULL_63_22]
MARKTQKRATTAGRRTYQPQDLLLAGIGAFSLGRKQIANAYVSGFDGVVELTDRTQEVVQAAASTLGQQVADIQKRAVSLRKQFSKRVEGFRKQAQTTLAPVFARLGVKIGPQRRKATRSRAIAKRSRRAA